MNWKWIRNIAKNVEENGPVRLGDEVFVFNKSYSWKVQDLRKFILNLEILLLKF